MLAVPVVSQKRPHPEGWFLSLNPCHTVRVSLKNSLKPMHCGVSGKQGAHCKGAEYHLKGTHLSDPIERLSSSVVTHTSLCQTNPKLG